MSHGRARFAPLCMEHGPGTSMAQRRWLGLSETRHPKISWLIITFPCKQTFGAMPHYTFSFALILRAEKKGLVFGTPKNSDGAMDPWSDHFHQHQRCPGPNRWMPVSLCVEKSELISLTADLNHRFFAWTSNPQPRWAIFLILLDPTNRCFFLDSSIGFKLSIYLRLAVICPCSREPLPWRNCLIKLLNISPIRIGMVHGLCR